MSKVTVFITREIVPFYYGGIGTLFMATAKFFKNIGCEVHFLSQYRSDFDNREYEKYYGKIPIHFASEAHPENFVEYSPTGGLVNTFNLAYSFSVAETYEKLADEIKPDMVISADFGAEPFILLLKKALGDYSNTRFIIHLSGALQEVLTAYQDGVKEDLFDELSEPRNRLVCLMEDTCMLLADEIISPSQSAWSQLSDRLKMPKRKVRMVPNLVDLKYKELATTEDIFNANQQKRNILFIGRLDHHKGADILLKLYIEYLKMYEDESRLIFIGRDCFDKGYQKTFLEEWHEKIPDPYRERIEFTGQVEPSRVKDHLEGASVCIFPSRWEVFGIVCLEAMAYGVPALVTRNTGLADLLGKDLEEYCFDFKTDSEAFLSKLHNLLSSKDNNLELRKKFRKRACDVIGMGDYGYRDILDDECLENKREISGDVVNNLITSLSVMSDISKYISNDFKTLKDHCNVSDDEVKEIIQKGDTVTSGNIVKKIRSFICSR